MRCACGPTSREQGFGGLEWRLELAQDDIPAGDRARGDIGRGEQTVCSRNDDDRVLAGVCHDDQRDARRRVGSGEDVTDVDPVRLEVLAQLNAERIGTDLAEHDGIGAEPRCSERLIRTLAAGQGREAVPGQSLSAAGLPGDPCHQVHVE